MNILYFGEYDVRKQFEALSCDLDA